MKQPGAIALGLTVVFSLHCAREAGPPIRMNAYWESVQQQLRPGMDAEEKAIAIARWVSRNGTNRFVGPDAPLLPFYGQCGHRVTVFVQLARRAGLRVARLRFDDFGQGRHVAAQVFYDDDWHYFDVTYAGYFRTDGKILSWDEIRADPEGAIRGLVVLGPTHDRWSDGRPVDNGRRMRQNYTPERVRSATVRFEPMQDA